MRTKTIVSEIRSSATCRVGGFACAIGTGTWLILAAGIAAAAFAGEAGVASQVDLRTNFVKWRLPLKKQGARNTCSVFTTVAGMEYALSKKFDSGIRLSEEYLNWACNQVIHNTTNDQLICYSKQAGDNLMVMVVNLDPYHRHSGWIEVPAARLGIEANRPYQVHDLLGDSRYLWHGERNYVELDPRIVPAHVFRVRRWVRTEHQFEYFL